MASRETYRGSGPRVKRSAARHCGTGPEALSKPTVVTPPPVARESAGSGPRWPALDGLRGLAILAVMLFHFWGLLPGLLGRTSTARVDYALARLFGCGWAGVDLFFVLSGFLITGILWDSRGRARGLRHFYTRRLLRILPLYYLFLAGVLWVGPLSSYVAGSLQVEALRAVQWHYWCFSMNALSGLRGLSDTIPLAYTHFWSLCVEEQFYLVWPFVVLGVGGRRRVMLVCAALMLAAPATRWAVSRSVFAEWFSLGAPYALTPCRLDALAVGGYIALALRGEPDEFVRLRRAAPAIGALAALLLASIFATHDRFMAIDPPLRTVGLSALDLGFGALLVLTIVAGPTTRLHRLLAGRVLTRIGTYSYGLYVLHLPIALLLLPQIARRGWGEAIGGSHLAGNVALSVAAGVTSLGAAALSWHFFERRVLALKRYVA